MSISGQQAINIGLPNESINSDSLYAAFNKTQENFTQLFTCASPFTNFVASTGIGITSNTTTGTVTVTNAGVTQIVAGTNVVVANVGGIVTISSTGGGGGGGGTVTSVGLAPVSTSRLVVTNSPIISSGTIDIDLATSGVAAGTYTNPSVTVDTYGRVTNILNGPPSGTVTSVGLTQGPGIQVNGGPITSVGNIVVTNTGVLKLTAGDGINLTGSTGNITVSVEGGVGTVSSINITSASLTVTGGPITTSGTINIELPPSPTISGNLTVANANLGNLATANFFSGNGYYLRYINAANINGTVATATTAGTVTTAAQPNITSVGTLTSLAVAASVNPNLGNNVSANYFTGSGQYLTNIPASNITGAITSASNATRVATTLTSTGVYYIPFITSSITANYGLNSNAAFTANLANGAILATTFVGNVTGNVTGTASSVTNSVTFNSTGSGAASGQSYNGAGAVTISYNTLGASPLAGSASLVTTGTVTTGVWNNNIGSSATFAAGLSGANLSSITGGNVTGWVANANVANYHVQSAQTTGTYYLSLANAATSSNVSLNANTNINVSVATGTLNATAFAGSGSGLTSLPAGQVTGTLPASVSNNISNVGTITVGTWNSAIGSSATFAAGLSGANLNSINAANVTGTFSSIGSSGNITAPNLIANTGYLVPSINAAVAAAGTDQATATLIAKQINVVSTVASGTGVVFPTPTAGVRITLINTSANTLAVYPASGGQIDALGTNAAFSLLSNARLDFQSTSTTQWYTLNASYL